MRSIDISSETYNAPAPVIDEIERLRADNEDLRKERDAYQSDAATLMKRVSEIESDDRPEGAEPCTDCGGHGYTL